MNKDALDASIVATGDGTVFECDDLDNRADADGDMDVDMDFSDAGELTRLPRGNNAAAAASTSSHFRGDEEWM